MAAKSSHGTKMRKRTVNKPKVQKKKKKRKMAARAVACQQLAQLTKAQKQNTSYRAQTFGSCIQYIHVYLCVHMFIQDICTPECLVNARRGDKTKSQLCELWVRIRVSKKVTTELAAQVSDDHDDDDYDDDDAT